ncbi:MAG: ABC transporter substrate-binding protein [Proteobacteria bacterium]|nr:ABC transporter substrate-binding protein [Pseudomonadota bacterium]MBI3497243.1 ABC transporter substrate-binding protein [Pseudomonadota bacterium]
MLRARGRFLTGAVVALACLFSLPAVETQAQQPKRGGAMTILLQPEPPMLMLPLSQFVPVLVTGGKIFQGLLTFDFDLKPMPSLAKSWSISPDGLTYTFKLEENVKWNDGKPFTSADVVFSTQVFLMEVHARARGNFQRVASVETPDANTVVYHLKEPFAPFLHAFEVSSAPMVPKHLYEGTDYRQNPANANPVGTGPFKLKEWVRGSYIHFVRNELYWKPGLPYLDEIYFRFLPDAASRALALESGQVDQSQFDAVEPYDVARLAQLPHLSMTTKGYEFLSPIMWLDLNVRNPPLNDKRFRQALLYGLDRDFIRDKLFFGMGKIASGPIASTTRFFDPSLPKYAYDPKKAAALLDEMGLKPGADGVRVHVKAMPLPYGEVWNRLAEYSRQTLGRVGIQLDIEPVDTPTWVQRTTNYEYELTWNYLSQFADPALGVARAYISTNIRKGIPSTNIGGYANPRVDELFAKAAVALSESEQQKLYSEVQRILVDDAPVGWMLEMQWPNFVNKRFHNVISTGLGPYESYDNVWRE